jgi:hypothetical protein
MTAPTASDIRRAICCPGGVCIAPEACYAGDPTRSYPVHIPSAADAVARLLCERWRETVGDTMGTQR